MLHEIQVFPSCDKITILQKQIYKKREKTIYDNKNNPHLIVSFEIVYHCIKVAYNSTNSKLSK